MHITHVHPIRPLTSVALIPVAGTAVHAGFPSAAQDYFSGEIDLNEQLIRDKAATYIVRVVGDSMEGAGISHGDELIVDRGLDPRHGNVVIAVVNGELTVKRLELFRGRVYLKPENPKYQPIQVRELEELHIWGVVTRCLHRLL